MQDNYLTKLLCSIVKNYINSTGLYCSFNLNNATIGCADCGECRKDMLCLFCGTSLEYAALCENQMVSASAIALELCQPYIFLCPIGLTRWAVPIINIDKHVGTVIAGCVRINKRLDHIEDMKPPHFDYFELPWQTFTQAWNEIPYKTPQQVHYAAQQLFYAVCYAMQTDNSIIIRAQKAWAEQSVLYEEISRQKNKQARLISPVVTDDEKFALLENDYNLELNEHDEYELLGRIQLGDKPAYRSILNKALGKIFLADIVDINTIKALLIELIISVGRMAFQRRISGDELFDLYSEAIADLRELHTINQIYSWTIVTFDNLADLIYSRRNEHTYSAVEMITIYVKNNFANDLTIENIANAINYSPSHVSRLFKDELNMTIFDYITEVRISKSKELLERTDLQVVAIAELVGYKDAAYFSRLFKKRVGINPSDYRRWWQGI